MQYKESLKKYCNSDKIKFRNKEYNKIKHNVNSFEEAYDIIESPEYCSCGKKSHFVSLKLGYSKYCSYECLHKDNAYSIKNIKNALIDSSFNKNYTAKALSLYKCTAKELYDKLFEEKTCIHCSNIAVFYSLTKGYSNFCSISCSNKSKDYSRSKEQNDLIQKKRKETTKKRYGVEHNFQLLNLSGEKNILSKDNFSQKSIKAKESRKNTLIKKYGVASGAYGKHIVNRPDLNVDYIKENFIKANKFNVLEAMNYFNCSRTYFTGMDLPSRPNYGEEWVYSIVQGKRNDRTLIKPLEIDVLNEEFKFGVEFNGLAYHSDGYSVSSVFNTVPGTSKNKYHLNKTNLVEEKGYQLFHIFENEYLDLNKRKIWQSMLNSKMHKTDRIYARKCNVKEITALEAKEFENKNHLQGYGHSSIRIALYDEDTIVSLMTFGKSRFNKNYQYELIRFCSKLNTTVIGAAGKLLSYFERTYSPKSLISYANRRWSQGNVYEKLNFTFLYDTTPNFFYFKPGTATLESRNKYQKHLLKDKLKDFNTDISAKENMFKNGYRVIYDSGNKVYVKEYD